MRVELNTLELDEREARAAIKGAEAAMRATKEALRGFRRQLLQTGVRVEPMADIERAIEAALQRTVGRFELELQDATLRFERAPTERGLKPVCVSAEVSL